MTSHLGQSLPSALNWRLAYHVRLSTNETMAAIWGSTSWGNRRELGAFLNKKKLKKKKQVATVKQSHLHVANAFWRILLTGRDKINSGGRIPQDLGRRIVLDNRSKGRERETPKCCAAQLIGQPVSGSLATFTLQAKKKEEITRTNEWTK